MIQNEHDGINPEYETRRRTRFTEKQLNLLEDNYIQNQSPNRAQILACCSKVNLPYKTVRIWFQNRRAKKRREDCNDSMLMNQKMGDSRKENFDYYSMDAEVNTLGPNDNFYGVGYNKPPYNNCDFYQGPAYMNYEPYDQNVYNNGPKYKNMYEDNNVYGMNDYGMPYDMDPNDIYNRKQYPFFK